MLLHSGAPAAARRYLLLALGIREQTLNNLGMALLNPGHRDIRRMRERLSALEKGAGD